MTEDLNELAGQVVSLLRLAVPIAALEVDAIIQSNSRDTSRINRQLDYLLDYCCEPNMMQAYKRLCRYYFDIDSMDAAWHVHNYREIWEKPKEFNTLERQLALALEVKVEKDRYTHEFLGLAERLAEREQAPLRLANLRDYFAQVDPAVTLFDSPIKLKIEGGSYAIDLLLFHRRLRCMVAIELRIGSNQPEHKRQIELYLGQLDLHHRMEGENPSIGIVICYSKICCTVDYVQRTSTNLQDLASYTITSELPVNLEGELPGPQQIMDRMSCWGLGLTKA